MRKENKGIYSGIFMLCAPVILFIAASCSPVMYAPSSNFTPLFTGQGQGHVNAQIGAGNDVSTSIQVQGAYSFADQWMFLAGFYHGKGEAENSDNTGKGSAFEAGVGYFAPLGQNERWRYEMIGSLQFGNAENNFGTYDLSNNIFKPSMAFNIGYKHRYYEIALSNKLAVVNMGNISFMARDTVIAVPDDVLTAMEQPTRFLWEPGIVLRAGAKNFKFQFYLGLSPMLSGKQWANDAMIMSLGLSSNFGRQKSRGMNW